MFPYTVIRDIFMHNASMHCHYTSKTGSPCNSEKNHTKTKFPLQEKKHFPSTYL
jgi:hypothetical protein